MTNQRFDLLDLNAQIAELRAEQRKWLDSRPDSDEPSPYFETICLLEDLRDVQREHLDVLDEMRNRSCLSSETHYRIAHVLAQE